MLEYADGRKALGTVPWSNHGWTLVRFDNRWWKYQYPEDGADVFCEVTLITEDFATGLHKGEE